jgi:hypothetical protein
MALNSNARRFIEVLRLGKYKQTVGRLHRETPNGEDCTYCWAGVACDLYMRTTGEGHWDGNGQFITDPGRKYLGQMPPEVREWLGLDLKQVGYFIDANDYGKTFPELADRMEVALCAVQ